MGVGVGSHTEFGAITYLARGIRQLRLLLAHGGAELLLAALIGVVAVDTLLERTHGVPTAALDDAYIHFQFAKSFAELKPFVYSPGTLPVPGATSLLWPALLAPFYALGLRDESLLWPAWLLSFASFGLLAYEARRIAERLVRPGLTLAAAALVLAFGGLVWSAGSGMEVVPCAWLMLRTVRRCAEWQEDPAARTSRRLAELLVLAFASPLMRPEAAIVSLGTAATLGAYSLGRRRAWALAAALAPVLPPLLYWVGTGEARTTTVRAKWLFNNPYFDVASALETSFENALYLLTSLMDGDLHSAVFLPRGGRVLAWLALPALALCGVRARAKWRAALIALVALGMFLPCTYETFLWNRLRYLWPFAAGWLVALCCLAEVVGRALGRLSSAFEPAPVLLGGAAAGTLLGHLPYAVDDLALSASGIGRQQVALGSWARDGIPEGSRIGVNDTGAIAYFSGHTTFDVVGLTTRGEALHWTLGPGARFEHYERLGPERLPTHFIVYPEWFGIRQLLGRYLTERNIPDSPILGGPRMVVYTANYRQLGSGERPLMPVSEALQDRVDVADYESERAHDYELFAGSSRDTVVFERRGALDGGRMRRSLDRFRLAVTPGGHVIARVLGPEAGSLRVLLDGAPLTRTHSDEGTWDEVSFQVPATIRARRATIEVSAPAGFASLHYWSYAAPSPAATTGSAP